MVLALKVTVWRKERPPRAAGITEDFMEGGEGFAGWIGVGGGGSRSKVRRESSVAVHRSD